VQVIVEAIINCGPREDSTRVGGGGAVRRQACDVSPIRRVNMSIYLITTGAREARWLWRPASPACLPEELLTAQAPHVGAVNRRDVYRLDLATRSISSFFLIAYELDEPLAAFMISSARHSAIVLMLRKDASRAPVVSR